MIDSRVTENINHNPYALGHMVNHVPKGGKPNIMQIMYDYMGPLRPDPFPVELQKHIPNRYTKEGTWLGTPDQVNFRIDTYMNVVLPNAIHLCSAVDRMY
jgi:hypothetical protein